MDTIVIGFVVGVVASAVSVILLVSLTHMKLLPQKVSRQPRRPQSAKVAVSRKQPKSRRVKSRSIRKLRVKPHPQPQPVGVDFETPTVALAQTIVSTCPSCGLQAPEILMMEHFTQSPSHQYGPVQPIATAAVTNIEAEANVEEDSDSVRSLLQMLVPPRAFGRRHANRTVNPLSRIVEATGDSGHTSFRP